LTTLLQLDSLEFEDVLLGLELLLVLLELG